LRWRLKEHVKLLDVHALHQVLVDADAVTGALGPQEGMARLMCVAATLSDAAGAVLMRRAPASDPVVFATLALTLFVMGLVYGPLGAWLPTLYAVPVRYTGMSIAFNVGGIIGGALAPFAAQALAMAGGTAMVGLFLTVAGAITLAGVVFAPRCEG
jgi:hypothetical protein